MLKNPVIRKFSTKTKYLPTIFNPKIFSKRPPSLFQIIAYLSFGALVVGIVLVTSTLAYCILNNEEEKREYAMYWYAEVPVPQLTFGIHVRIFELGKF
jgi:hypothetical protein